MKKLSILNSIQYLSDIHLEYYTLKHQSSIPKMKKISDNLALLGDIGNPFLDNYKEFLNYVSGEWNQTFLITGNHEYWQEKYSISDVDNKISDLLTKFNNITFLNNTSYEFSNYTLLGTTLWSKILNPPKRIMGDDLYIPNMNFEELNKLHNKSVEWLEKESSLNEPSKTNSKNIIVLTHHLPSYKLIIDKYQDSKFQDRFASDLEYLMKDHVKYWLSGHSHCKYETIINDTFCGINACNDNMKEKIIKLVD